MTTIVRCTYMIITDGPIADSAIIAPELINDERGSFTHIFCANEFQKHGLRSDFVQFKECINKLKGTLRGMHYQFPSREVKLVRCIKGSIYDVIIDMRKDSLTYMDWYGIELTEYNGIALYVPEYCAHGYITQTNYATVQYMVTDFYTPEDEHGVRWNDPAFNVKWIMEPRTISKKDKAWPDFHE